jgi:hypothetical protein
MGRQARILACTRSRRLGGQHLDDAVHRQAARARERDVRLGRDPDAVHFAGVESRQDLIEQRLRALEQGLTSSVRQRRAAARRRCAYVVAVGGLAAGSFSSARRSAHAKSLARPLPSA